MQNYTTDVCIIGAGPAGIMSSLTLSKNGINHIIVDGATFPRQKPCADAITRGTVRLLNEIDPEIINNLILEGGLNQLDGNKIYIPKSVFSIKFSLLENKPSTFSISRFNFDNYLVSIIKKYQFCNFLQNTRIIKVNQTKDCIELKSSNSTINCKMIIVATGSQNAILKQFSHEIPKKHLALGLRVYYENVSCKDNISELFLDPLIMPGGLQITPLSDNKFNITLVILAEKVEQNSIKLIKILDTLLEKNEYLKEKFKNAKRISSIDGSMLYLGSQKRDVVENRCLFAGDSAGLIDILNANGIPQAMISGKMAALKAIDAINANDFSKEFLLSYQTALHKRMENMLSLGRIVYPFLRIDWLNKITINLMIFFLQFKPLKKILNAILNHSDPKKIILNPLFYYKALRKNSI